MGRLLTAASVVQEQTQEQQKEMEKEEEVPPSFILEHSSEIVPVPLSRWLVPDIGSTQQRLPTAQRLSIDGKPHLQQQQRQRQRDRQEQEQIRGTPVALIASNAAAAAGGVSRALLQTEDKIIVYTTETESDAEFSVYEMLVIGLLALLLLLVGAFIVTEHFKQKRMKQRRLVRRNHRQAQREEVARKNRTRQEADEIKKQKRKAEKGRATALHLQRPYDVEEENDRGVYDDEKKMIHRAVPEGWKFRYVGQPTAAEAGFSTPSEDDGDMLDDGLTLSNMTIGEGQGPQGSS